MFLLQEIGDGVEEPIWAGVHQLPHVRKPQLLHHGLPQRHHARTSAKDMKCVLQLGRTDMASSITLYNLFFTSLHLIEDSNFDWALNFDQVTPLGLGDTYYFVGP